MTRTINNPVWAKHLVPWAVAFAAILVALPAMATSSHVFGTTSICTALSPPTPSQRFQCNFPVLSASQRVEIQYASMQCGSTGATPFSLQAFHVLTTPPNSNSEVDYYVFLTNQGSLGEVVTAGSAVKLYQKAGMGFRALIDFSPSVPAAGVTQCTVSISGELEE